MHEDGAFFAADTPGAKAHHRLVRKLGLVLRHSLRELCELGDAPIDGTREGAVVNLKSVAGIQHHDRLTAVVMPLIQPALKRLRRNAGRTTC